MGDGVKGISLKRAGKTNNHHYVPKSRGGTKHPRNGWNLDINRHNAFHDLFGLRTFEEAAELLLEAQAIKRWKKWSFDVCAYRLLFGIFGTRTFEKAAAVLLRAAEMQKRRK